ncbi:unnamed protein product [Rotaria magnacalcarata]|uniref:DYW domain-containing protein n=1 Tax=Rotaria magnacalcarata TaxID=392030 RepID=A0A816SAC0_9BILA|nr:unnamed protein product [Rotaria magnacalcarata]CAF2081419.1 unnamed protein product [Rotaria magnacalcarata]CAF3795985.1 unnamed protein product [Rotaria magnacalcarata]CAF4146906.1 unnamed protein product [Rotaria magnacalcarata]CAF4170679.1 unnamed protein product [Rotaria magnacalcarata]
MPQRAIDLFSTIEKPDKIIFTVLFNACSQIQTKNAFDFRKKVFNQLPIECRHSTDLLYSVLNMFIKRDDLDDGECVFNRINRFNFLWIDDEILQFNAYGINGMGLESVQLFHKVPATMLDNCIYVCTLNTCSHSELVNEARKIFETIPINQRKEQILTTMVDAFSCAFDFDQAQKLIEEFERYNPPSIPMYMSLLSSTRNEKNASLSQKIFDRIESNFPDAKNVLTSAAVLLANTHALRGNTSMATNTFRAPDQSHSCSSEIYTELNKLQAELIAHGYKLDASWITRPLKDNETPESVLCAYNEGIAIVFNLIQRPMPTRIQIMQNLRICGDCHAAIKLIAQIRQCLIVIRDANRIHHFYPNGQCSCQDHF